MRCVTGVAAGLVLILWAGSLAAQDQRPPQRVGAPVTLPPAPQPVEIAHRSCSACLLHHIAMKVNRRALKSSGGKCSSPSWMTTKLTPQTAVTSTSRAMERAGMVVIVGPVMVQSQ